MGGPEIRLETASGATVLVRLIRRGERYGPGARMTNSSAGTLLDFHQPRGAALLHVGTHWTENVKEACEHGSFTPGDKLPFRLERVACRRLLDWLADPYAPSTEAFTALLIGDEERCGRAAVTLRRLGLETKTTHDPVNGLARATAMQPSLVLVDADGLVRMTAAQVVAALHRSEAGEVPVIVVAADPAAHRDLGADAVLATPLDQDALTAAVSELFELV